MNNTTSISNLFRAITTVWVIGFMTTIAQAQEVPATAPTPVNIFTGEPIPQERCLFLSNATATPLRLRGKALSEIGQREIKPLFKVNDKLQEILQVGSDAKEIINLRKKEMIVLAKENASDETDPQVKLSNRSKIASYRSEISQLEKTIAQSDKDYKAYLPNAIKALDSMRAKSDKLQPYDMTVMWNYYAYFYSAVERYEDAIAAYQRVLASAKELAPSMYKNGLLQLGQLQLLTERYGEGTELLETWFAVAREHGDKFRVSHYFTLGQGQAFSNANDKAYATVEDAIDLGACNHIAVPKKSYLQLMVTVANRAKKPEKALAPAELMVIHYPDRRNWLTLQAIYDQVGQKPNQINVLLALWQQDLLTKESEYIALSQHLQNNKLNYWAGLVVLDGYQKEIVKHKERTLKQLAENFERAHSVEQAIKFYKLIAKEDKSGRYEERIARLYFYEGQFKLAEEYFTEALEKGGLLNEFGTRMFRANSIFEQKDYPRALKIYQELEELPEAENRNIAVWIKSINQLVENRKIHDDRVRAFNQEFAQFIVQNPEIQRDLERIGGESGGTNHYLDR